MSVWILTIKITFMTTNNRLTGPISNFDCPNRLCNFDPKNSQTNVNITLKCPYDHRNGIPKNYYIIDY